MKRNRHAPSMRHLQTLAFIDRIARCGSLRSAAEELGITPSALNRRILAVEEELGVQIFERHPAGLRPNIAGEILLEHIRNQLADMERVKSRIADLSGMRAGHVRIATTREPVAYFLPGLIRDHLLEFPAVTFSVNLLGRGEAENSLLDNSNDIAFVFEPVHRQNLQTVFSAPQELLAVLSADHPLAARGRLHIYECADFPLLLPQRPEGIRQILDEIAARTGITLRPAVESNSLELLRLMSQNRQAISFCLPVNRRPDLQAAGLVALPLHTRGVPSGVLVAGHLKGRTLPVAAARFLETAHKQLALQFS